MAQQRSRTNPSSSSGAGPSLRRISLRGGKRARIEEGDSAELPESGYKRARMAEAGAVREEVSQDAQREEAQEDDREGCEHLEETCPTTDKHEQPFRLMDMPPEIRMEIYRACLTRPFNILLSKEPKPADREKEKERAESMLRDQEFLDETAWHGSESEDDVLVHSHGSDPGNLHTGDTNAGSAGGSDAWPARGMRALRSITRMRSAGLTANTTISVDDDPAPAPEVPTHVTSGRAYRVVTNTHANNPPRGRRSISTSVKVSTPRAPRPQDDDPLLVSLLQASKLIYKEARAILYGENTFLLDLDTAQPTLAALHQRSRGQIKNLRVTIPTHNDILEHFTEVVRLSLRYCWRLQQLVIHTPFVLPGAEGSSTSGNTTVYANAFDILRWLPKQTEVVLEGNVCEEIRKVVEKNSNLAKSLDEVSFPIFVDEGGLSFFDWLLEESSDEDDF